MGPRLGEITIRTTGNCDIVIAEEPSRVKLYGDEVVDVVGRGILEPGNH